MRLIIALAITSIWLAAAAVATPQKYLPNKDHAQILFAVDHFGFSKTHGVFRRIDGTLLWDDQNPENSTVQIVIKANSIDTGNVDRDKDLLGADFLEAQKYPDIHFVSTKVTKSDPKTLQIAGNLSMHGKTKPITFTTTLNKAAPNPFDKSPTVGFSSSASLKRSDFNVAGYLPGIGDDVTFTLDVEFNQVK